MVEQLVIETESGKKGRSFAVDLLCHVSADPLWEEGRASVDHHRPVWLSVGGPDAAVRAFVANLLLGRKATRGTGKSASDRFEVLKSAGFAASYVAVPGGGLVAHVYHRELFDPSPGFVDPDRITFVCMPSRAWCARQVFEEKTLRHAENCMPEGTDAHGALCEGVLLLKFIERRTRCPFPPHPLFGYGLLLASLRAGILFRSKQSHYDSGALQETGTERVGFAPGFAFYASHETFQEVLQATIIEWFVAGRFDGQA